MATDIRLPTKWIELNITKRECVVFMPSSDEDNEQLCKCGRLEKEHLILEVAHHRFSGDPWIPSVHTKEFQTDAYGTIVFQGEHHPNKSHYVRLSHDTNPETVIQLMTLVWGLPMPKLLISIRGSNTNFDLPPRLGKILQVGLIKAAKTTGAWIVTNGLNRGVAKHIGNTLANQRLFGLKRGRGLVSIGICPFGIVQDRHRLTGHNRDIDYNPLEQSSSKYLMLNPKHSNFLLVDNGTVGKSGGESVFRLRLEKRIGRNPTSPSGGCDTPVVCLVIGGSFNTLRNILDYLYDDPPVPVVIFSGTGVTTDLITNVLKRIYTGLTLEDIRAEVCALMIKWYNVTEKDCDTLFDEMQRIITRKNLITIYNASNPDSESFDTVLLASLFRSQHWTPYQQLSLTLVWDRVDIATHEVFVYGRDWSLDDLEKTMMEALSSNRLNFVELLIEHGLNMQTFLTSVRLEELYSLDRTNSIVMRTLLFELVKIRKTHKRFKTGPTTILEKNLTLHDVGFAMAHMMGYIYKSRYSNFKTRKRNPYKGDPAETATESVTVTFTQPFDDLFIWAVLTKRHNMALLLWKHGIGALAKALVAVRLNKYLVEEFTTTEKTETNLAAEFQAYADEWERLSYSLLDVCFKTEGSTARKLLTMELEHWSKQTCLTLAVIATHRMLLGHPCCQILLADLWMGPLSLTKRTVLKVLIGVLFPPLALWCDFKTRQELKLLPHQGKKEGQLNVNIEDQDLLDSASLQTFSKSRASISSSIFMKRSFNNYLNLIGSDEAHNKKNTTEKLKIEEKATHHHHALANKTEMVYKQPQGDQTVFLGSNFIVKDINAVDKNLQNHVTIIEDITSSEDSDFETRKKLVQKKIQKIDKYKDIRAAAGTVGSSYVTTKQELSLFRKLYEFQKAPITNFYRHTIGYLVFLGCLAYVILVPQNHYNPGYVEMYTIAYIVALGFDTLREFISVDAYSWSQKWHQFQTNNWSLSDFVMVVTFLLGTTLRLYPGLDKLVYSYGMLIYKVSSIYWNLRLYKFLSNHRWVGPKLVMMTRMLKHMIYFAMIIMVVLIAFGISREAIRFPDTYPTWRSIAEAFLEPYVMFYGEIDIESLSPQCGEEFQPACPVGHWIIPLTWTIYMMVANILIVNVLIAVFNGIYAEVDAIALELWMFQRFTFVMEYQSKPLLPPPFVILCHLYYALRFIYLKCRSCACDEDFEENELDIEEGKRVMLGNDRSLKTFLSLAETNRAFDFEEDNLDNINISPLQFDDFTTRKTLIDVDPLRRSIKSDNMSYIEMSENRILSDVQQKILDIYSEMENQRVKLDKILGYLESDEDEQKSSNIH